MINGLVPHSGYSEELLKYYYSPNLVLKNSGDEFLNLYCFIAKIDPWDDENNPPVPVNSDYYLKSITRNLVALKRINTNDICPVIQRIDWTYGVIYNQYSSSVAGNTNYYVRNSYDQIFKCLSNGTTETSTAGSQSIRQPIIDFTTNFVSDVIDTDDGYKWKYLYTIDPGVKVKFFDDNWMPISITTHRESISTSKVGFGEVSVINIYNGGDNYTNDIGKNITTTIKITGDGTGASASAIIDNNTAIKILMANTGSGYTYATAELIPSSGYAGSGAILIPEVSPIGGHGHNLIAELGCKAVMVTAEFNGSETGVLPTDIDYRQIGLIANPEIELNGKTIFANSSIYKATHDVTVSNGSGIYEQDEIVFQGTRDNPSYSGKVLNFDKTNNLLYLINTQGTIKLFDGLYGTQASRIVLQEVIEQIIPYSGNILYIENRTKAQRNPSGLEQFRLTLNY